MKSLYQKNMLTSLGSIESIILYYQRKRSFQAMLHHRLLYPCSQCSVILLLDQAPGMSDDTPIIISITFSQFFILVFGAIFLNFLTIHVQCLQTFPLYLGLNTYYVSGRCPCGNRHLLNDLSLVYNTQLYLLVSSLHLIIV